MLVWKSISCAQELGVRREDRAREEEQIRANANSDVRAGNGEYVALALIDLEAFVPFLKSFAAILLQFLVC